MSDPVQDAINNHPDKVDVVWYPRTMNPSPGLVWATDGTMVWPIFTEGVIPDNAHLVRAWSNACIPKPPAELPK